MSWIRTINVTHAPAAAPGGALAVACGDGEPRSGGVRPGPTARIGIAQYSKAYQKLPIMLGIPTVPRCKNELNFSNYFWLLVSF